MSSKKCCFLILLTIFLGNICCCSASGSNNKIRGKQIIDESVEPILIESNSLIKTAHTVKDRPTIALALGGGGIRGASHIGVLRVLQKEGIPIDYIAGCSMGSIVGGLFCAGVPLDDIEKILLDKSFKQAYAPAWTGLSLMVAPFKSFNSPLRPYAGLVTGKYFSAFIDKNLPPDKKLVENTNLPFIAVATNLNDCKAYKLAKGKLADCILASSAMPPVIRPLEIKGNMYIDGGLSSNVPVPAARQFGADIVIAVAVDQIVKTEPTEKFRSIISVGTRMSTALFAVVDEHDAQKADLLITPAVSDIPIFTTKFKYIKPAIQAGEDAAYAALPAIREALKKSQLKIPSKIQQ